MPEQGQDRGKGLAVKYTRTVSRAQSTPYSPAGVMSKSVFSYHNPAEGITWSESNPAG